MWFLFGLWALTHCLISNALCSLFFSQGWWMKVHKGFFCRLFTAHEMKVKSGTSLRNPDELQDSKQHHSSTQNCSTFSLDVRMYVCLWHTHNPDSTCYMLYTHTLHMQNQMHKVTHMQIMLLSVKTVCMLKAFRHTDTQTDPCRKHMEKLTNTHTH